MRRLASIPWALGLLVLGCNGSGSDGTSSDSNDDTTTAGTTTEAGTFSGPDPTTTGGGDTTDEGLDVDTGPVGPGAECILEDNDCSDPAQKCMPWSENADRVPDGARCCPLQDTPDLVGERCAVEEYDGSCLDSCDENMMCLVDDSTGLGGLCRAFCDPSSPTCNEGQGTCKSFFELIPGALTVPLCMDRCDPVLQDCSPGSWHCIPDSPTPAGQSGFICVPPPPEEPLGLFEPCGLANDCEQGLVCLLASRMPAGSCQGSNTCCGSYCDLTEGDAPCQAIDPELTCVDWMSPDPTWSDVGVCALPA